MQPGPDVYSSTDWTTWGIRPILLFTATYTVIAIVHEWAHALTAYALKVPATLIHLYVHINSTDRTLSERALIGMSGPLVCLVVGLVCWFTYRRAQGSRAALLFLYLAWFGIATFFGNMISTPFVGDFSWLALLFQAPMWLRYGICLAGLLSLCGLAFLVGTELRRFSPAGVIAVRAMLGMVALPAILGSAVALIIFQPMSSDFAIGRAGEVLFWIFGAVGTLVSRKPPAERTGALGPNWLDFALLLFAVLIVRVMSRGIAFVA